MTDNIRRYRSNQPERLARNEDAIEPFGPPPEVFDPPLYASLRRMIWLAKEDGVAQKAEFWLPAHHVRVKVEVQP